MKQIGIYLKEHSEKKYKDFYINTYFPTKDENDKEFVNSHKKEIFNFLDKGQRDAGLGEFHGCDNANTLARNANCVRIGYDINTDEMIAVSVYTGYQDGKKCVGITAITDKEKRKLGKECLYQIVKEDINAEKEYYWTQCSGAIEHIWNKFNGTQIPNIFVEDYIGKKKYKLSDENQFHFFLIDKNGDEFKKTIFGYNSEKTMNKVQKYMDEYVTTQIEERTINESLSDEQVQELSEKYQWNLAAFIEVISVDGWYELPQDTYNTFMRLIKDSEKLFNANKNNCTETFINNLKTCKSLIEDVSVLKMHKISK